MHLLSLSVCVNMLDFEVSTLTYPLLVISFLPYQCSTPDESIFSIDSEIFKNRFHWRTNFKQRAATQQPRWSNRCSTGPVRLPQQIRSGYISNPWGPLRLVSQSQVKCPTIIISTLFIRHNEANIIQWKQLRGPGPSIPAVL
jgi:hypothetical protein